jgi:hypothetical protein
MKKAAVSLALVVLFAAALAAQPAKPAAAKVLDQELSMLERELVPLAEAMPAEKYGFAPTQGEFAGVRTFAQQVSHTAVVLHMVAASVLKSAIPDAGPQENGPAGLKTKDDIVKYLKEAVAHGHEAMNSLTEANLLEKVPSAFGKNEVPRLSMANVAIWHSFDHYGQMAVYARLNGIVPPASRR